MNVRRYVERYINCNGKTWVRIKYMDIGTEVIMPEEDFRKRYKKSFEKIDL